MFMSVFLAVVYNRFRSNLKNEVRESVERAEVLMDRAFDKAAAAAACSNGRDEGMGERLCQSPFYLRQRISSLNFRSSTIILLKTANVL